MNAQLRSLIDLYRQSEEAPPAKKYSAREAFLLEVAEVQHRHPPFTCAQIEAFVKNAYIQEARSAERRRNKGVG